MKTASAKVSDEEYQSLAIWCQDHNTTMNEVIRTFIRDLVKGKARPPSLKLTKRIGICPVCGEQMLLYQESGNCYLLCLNCDATYFLGPYTLHKEKIQDYREFLKKLKEV